MTAYVKATLATPGTPPAEYASAALVQKRCEPCFVKRGVS